jgi:PB1 domain
MVSHLSDILTLQVHYQGDVRGMALTTDTSYEEFMDTLSIKFGVAENKLDVKFKDEDGEKVSLKDDMDYEMAMETVKETGKDKTERRLEIWCTDI